MGSDIVPQIILIVILTALNAFFASAEMAVVSLNKTKIRILASEGNKKAKKLEALIEEPTKFLSTIQVGITLAGFYNSASAATGISEDLGQVLTKLGIPYGQQISLVMITLLLSYITLVFGELVPKRIALQKAESLAMFAVGPILFISKITAPFIKLLSLSTNFVLRIIGMNKEGLDESVSKEEIRSLVEVGKEHGIINETESEMIHSAMEFDDKTANEIMIPRTEVYMINIERPLSEYIDEMLQERYSRIPVFEGDIDNIIGVLYMKDFMLEARKVGFDHVDLRSILQSAYFVPERKTIDELFKELQTVKKHMAILIDEYGGFSGIVTIEDLIEEIMGDIEDEYDEDEPDLKVIDSTTFLVKGTIAIHELNDRLHLDLDEEEDYDTLAGLIIQQLGHIPSEEELVELEYHGLSLKVERVHDKRIELVKLCKPAVPVQ